MSSEGAAAQPDSGVLVRMSISPWTDLRFVKAVEAAWAEVRADSEIQSSSVAAAAMAEGILHHAGYPFARVRDRRTLDEALGHVAHWQVLRDGRDA